MKNKELKIRKGGLVKAAPVDDPSWDPPIKGFYHLTREEIEEWYEDKRAATREARAKGEDAFSINFDDAGESRLPPQDRYQRLNTEMVYEVLRARCRVSHGYHMESGQVKILDTETGRELYCDREDLIVVG
ncbi:MAG: hypothetical protein ABGY95_10965 [Rubritalea sp.]|jgi:hypothetical protein|uniref:hypothetical protein n=1 Tax=Rubritalea sp. TaxID=2109375 RepID=UPI003242661E